MNDVLTQLQMVLKARKSANVNKSYVASLHQKGLDAILKKIGEETTELVMAAKDGDTTHIIHESADLLFHMMVLLSQQNTSIVAVLDELSSRFDISGIDEKNARIKKKEA